MGRETPVSIEGGSRLLPRDGLFCDYPQRCWKASASARAPATSKSTSTGRWAGSGISSGQPRGREGQTCVTEFELSLALSSCVGVTYRKPSPHVPSVHHRER